MPDEDVEFIDQYAGAHGLESRSGVVQRAVSLLRASELGADYAAAWEQWSAADGELWAGADADGLEDATR
jgi:Arc/MetJ-type ribon-helix-helix transcriptional regulator